MKPIIEQYFKSLKVKSFTNFFVADANMNKKRKQMSYLKNMGAATYFWVRSKEFDAYRLKSGVDVRACEEQIDTYIDLSYRQNGMNDWGASFIVRQNRRL
jgi:hypothetical protein